jgi:hypothetical protein
MGSLAEVNAAAAHLNDQNTITALISKIHCTLFKDQLDTSPKAFIQCHVLQIASGLSHSS